jgi:carboxymethylenebutenolidase
MRTFLALVAGVALLGCGRSRPPRPAEPSEVGKPLPTSETVKYPSGKTTISGYLCRPNSKGRFPPVLMIPDRMGLTEGLKKQAFQLSRKDYVVLIVDPYRGELPDTSEDAQRLERELSRERLFGDIKATIDYLCDRADVLHHVDVRNLELPGECSVGVIGFGMGGTYALEAALRDMRLRAVVTCYAPLPTDPKRLAALKASVLVILAGKDKSVPQEMVESFRKAMIEAHKNLEGLRGYSECPHGFLDPANWPIYGEPSLDDVVDAWNLIARYLDKELR